MTTARTTTNLEDALVDALDALRVKVEQWAESEDSDGHTEIVNWEEMCAARKLVQEVKQ